jgi:histone arginine demethylase JMJD6
MKWTELDMNTLQKPPAAVEVERRANLSAVEFANRYLYKNKPVIVTDALRGWKAMTSWTPEFFKARFGDMRFTIAGREHGQKGYAERAGEEEYTMAQFIDRVSASTDEKPAPYFRNRILYDLFPSLKDDIEPLPPYFTPNWLPERYLVSPVGKVLNRGSAIELYIGGKGGAFPVLHYDGVGTHAFLMQVYGRKKFVIYPPDQEPYLYPSPEKRNLSLVDNIDAPDLDKFPQFAHAVATTFILEPGELLFVPSHWWHTTKMLTPSITLSINTVNDSNWHELVDYVAGARGNPVVSTVSRAYLMGAGAWRSWRDRDWVKRAQGDAS